MNPMPQTIALVLMLGDAGIPDIDFGLLERFGKLKGASKQSLNLASSQCLSQAWPAMQEDLKGEQFSKGARIEVRVKDAHCVVHLGPEDMRWTGGAFSYFVENGKVVARHIHK